MYHNSKAVQQKLPILHCTFFIFTLLCNIALTCFLYVRFYGLTLFNEVCYLQKTKPDLLEPSREE